MIILRNLEARIVGGPSPDWWRAIFFAPKVHIFWLIHRAQATSLRRSLFLLRKIIGVGPPLIIELRRNSSSRWLLGTSKLVLIRGAAPIYSWCLPCRILLMWLLLLEILCISLVPSVLILVRLTVLWLYSTFCFRRFSVTPEVNFSWILLHVPSVRAAASVSWNISCVIHVSCKI